MKIQSGNRGDASALWKYKAETGGCSERPEGPAGDDPGVGALGCGGQTPVPAPAHRPPPRRAGPKAGRDELKINFEQALTFALIIKITRKDGLEAVLNLFRRLSGVCF